MDSIQQALCSAGLITKKTRDRWHHKLRGKTNKPLKKAPPKIKVTYRGPKAMQRREAGKPDA